MAQPEKQVRWGKGNRLTYQTILLVEDNPDDEALTLRAFKKNNVPNTVIVAHDGAEAIELLFPEASDRMTHPGLILLDLNLPKIAGLEVLRRVRADERTRVIPVVVLTSSAQPEDIFSSYDRGANAFVRKPVDFSEFNAAISTICNFWILLNKPAPESMP
jgi:two-component system response regulator